MAFNTSQRRYSQPKSALQAEADRLALNGMYQLEAFYLELVENSPADVNFIPVVPLMDTGKEVFK